jgi:hypothetical protein
MPQQARLTRTLAILYLLIQGGGLIVWWAMLLAFPATREPFTAPNAPESTLFAFILPDLLVYAAGSFITAYGLAAHKSWAWPALCFVTGATVYASLYAFALPFLSGGAWLGAAFMLPPMVVMCTLTWLLRPETLR